MIVNEVANSRILARVAAADTIVIARNASESSDYLAALRAGDPEDDGGWGPMQPALLKRFSRLGLRTEGVLT